MPDTTDEQKVNLFGYSQAVDELVKVAKSKKEDLDHNILLAENQLKQLKESLDRERSQFNIWKRQKEDEFKNEMDLRQNKIIERENSLDVATRQIEQRLADIKTREIQSLQVSEDKTKLDEERIEINRLRNEVIDLRHSTNITQADVSSKLSFISQREKSMDDLKKEIDTKNIELSIRENKYEENIKKLELEKSNLEKLKEIVDPKMREIDLQLKSIKTQQEDIDKQARDVANRIEEDKAMIRAIEERDLKLKNRERELDSLEQELNRKSLLKGIDK